MKEVNVLYAFNYKDGNTAIVSYIKKKMETELSDAGVKVLSIETVKSKDQIEEKLDTGKYNVLICKEQLGDEKISSGSLKVWGQRYPEVTVILNVSNDKKGGEKLVKFLGGSPSYYNALYDNDLIGANVANLLRLPRTKEEAIVYYGLEKRLAELPKESETIREPENMAEAAAEEKEEEQSMVTPIEEEKEVITREEFDKVISGFDEVDFDAKIFEKVTEEKPDIAMEAAGEQDKEKSTEFDFAAMFGGKDLFEEAEKKTVVDLSDVTEDRSKRVPLNQEQSVDKMTETVCMKEPEVKEKSNAVAKNETGDIDMTLTVEQIDEVTLPDTAKVLKVFDQNTMLVEILPAPILPKEKTMEDYKMFFVVKGTRGAFIDGKYKVGVKSFEGYPGSLLGKQVVIVEVPDYDLIQNALEGANCGLIFMEQ